MNEVVILIIQYERAPSYYFSGAPFHPPCIIINSDLYNRDGNTGHIISAVPLRDSMYSDNRHRKVQERNEQTVNVENVEYIPRGGCPQRLFRNSQAILALTL